MRVRVINDGDRVRSICSDHAWLSESADRVGDLPPCPLCAALVAARDGWRRWTDYHAQKELDKRTR